MSLIELTFATVILLVGLGGVGILFLTSTTSTSRNKVDTGGTLAAKMVLEQISAQNPNSASTIIITDCAGTAWTVNSTPAAFPGAGATLNQTAGSLGYGGIDWTQDAPSGYRMRYKGCESGGASTTYEVRWNVMTISANTTRLITVSARQSGVSSTRLGGANFAMPVNLRGIGAR